MRIAYWTTACLDEQIEAVSKEVFDLAAAFPHTVVMGVSPHVNVQFASIRARAIAFHPRYDVFLRVLIPLLERAADVNHIYSEISPWVFFKSLRKRPTLLTVASEKGGFNGEFIDRCKAIAVQTEGMRRRLIALTTERKVHLVYPGISLQQFRPRSDLLQSSERTSILFATFPRSREELDGRGVTFLLEAASQHPELDFTFVSRPWRGGSTALVAVKEAISARCLGNIRVLEGVQENMEELYRQHTFTVIPFATSDGGKECPRSLIETLACGVPVLISNLAPFSSFVSNYDCGAVFPLTVAGFGGAVENALRNYSKLSSLAAKCARESFDAESTRRTYARLYDQIV